MFQKKSLGQNFLKNKHIIQKIVDTGSVKKTDNVLEIGPGKGALTEFLLDTGAQVFAIEKDSRLMTFLNEKFHEYVAKKQLHIIEGDIEKLDIAEVGLQRHYKLIANIPYYITGLIIRKFLETDLQPTEMVVLVQKEVAQRIIARDGKESLLSISVKVYGEPKMARIVKAGNFEPKPKVDSAILHISGISKKFFNEKNIDELFFFNIVRTGFSSKRKVLLNNLSPFASKEEIKEIFKEMGADEKSRAEELTLQNWADITKSLADIKK